MEHLEMVKDYANIYNELLKAFGIAGENKEMAAAAQIAFLHAAATIQQNKILFDHLSEISKGITTIVGLLAMGHIRTNDEDNSEYRQPGY